MPAIATRFLWVTLLFVAGAAIAVGSASMDPVRNDTCADPGALSLDRFPGVEDVREDPESAQRERMIQHERGIYRTVQDGRRRARFEVQINRSWEPRTLYERPSRWVKGLENAEHHDLDADASGVPTHYISNHTTGSGRVAAYTFVYGNRNTESPFGVQIRNGWEELRHGKQPLTMITVAASVRPRHEEEWRREARNWLGEAVAYYRSVCGE